MKAIVALSSKVQSTEAINATELEEQLGYVGKVSSAGKVIRNVSFVATCMLGTTVSV